MSYLADPDLLIKWMKCPSGAFDCYAYVLCYVDDVLVIGHDVKDALKKLDKYFGLNPGSRDDLKQYLGAKGKENEDG